MKDAYRAKVAVVEADHSADPLHMKLARVPVAGDYVHFPQGPRKVWRVILSDPAVSGVDATVILC